VSDVRDGNRLRRRCGVWLVRGPHRKACGESADALIHLGLGVVLLHHCLHDDLNGAPTDHDPSTKCHNHVDDDHAANEAQDIGEVLIPARRVSRDWTEALKCAPVILT